MRETFTWLPEWESQLDQEPKVTVTKFGDGYEQRVPQGINIAAEKWQLTFSESIGNFSEVLTFLRARNGVESFYWTTPLNEQRIFVCRKWTLRRKMGVNVITADFEEVFES